MAYIEQKQYVGRKAKIGSIGFNERGALCLVAGYCPDCNGKVLWTPEEMQEFKRKFHRERKKLVHRLLLTLLRRYAH